MRRHRPSRRHRHPRRSGPHRPRRQKAWIPQAWVTRSPGSRTSRSSAVTKAFGGQVIGSMATALRRQVGPQRVAREDLQPAVAIAGPQARPRAVLAPGGKVGPGPAVAVAAQPGERVVQPGGADDPRLTEVVLGAVDGLRRTRRDAAVVHRQPAAGGQRQLAPVDRGRPDRQVRVRAGTVGRGVAAPVRAVTVTRSPVSGSSRYSPRSPRRTGIPAGRAERCAAAPRRRPAGRLVQAIHRVSPWMALSRAGSVRASWWFAPPKTYRPPSTRFGQGASSWPAPAGGSSSAS